MVENVLTHIELKRRSDIHWARKLWHMGGVFLLFLAWNFLSTTTAYITLGILVALFIPFDFMRHNRPGLNDLLVHMFRPLLRENEVNRLAGTTYLLSGVLAIALLFPKPIVSLTLLFLAFADPIASFIGIKYGRDKIFGHKSIQGFMAAFVVCVTCSFAFMMVQNHPLDRSIVFSLLAGLVGAFAELIPLGKLDDNLTLPLMSSVGLSVLFYFFGLL